MVMQAVLELKSFPAGMELFPAIDKEQFDYIKKVIDDSDYYLLIIGARYGSLDENGVSFTEKEYDYAVKKGIPVIAFLHSDISSIPLRKADDDKKLRRKLEAFRSKVQTGRLVNYWKNAHELKSKVISSLVNVFDDQPRVGWVRANAVARGDAQKEIDRLQKEIEGYKSDLKKLKADLKKKADECQSLETSNQDSQKEISNLQRKIEEIKNELDKLKAQEEEWQNDHAAVVQSYQEKVNDIAGDLEKVLEKLKGDSEFPKSSSFDQDTITTPRIDTLTIPDIDTITIPGTDVSFKMLRVEGGTFMMGASDGYSNEIRVHQVTLSDYWIGETQVTQALWETVMGKNPSNFTGDPKRPVKWVSWVDCRAFIRKLNKLTGKKFRLPTEAEWEFAARGGNKTKGYIYAGSYDIFDIAWYDENSHEETHPVGELDPNELGLYDMSGNVFEWCFDFFDYYSSDDQLNPIGPSSGSKRVLRGGSYCNVAKDCRVSYRNYDAPTEKFNNVGLRLAL